MSTYVVNRAEFKKQAGDKMQVIKLWLRDADGPDADAETEAEWFCPKAFSVPSAGSHIEGTLKMNEEWGRWDFKDSGKRSTSTNGYNVGRGSGDFSPEAQARIDAKGRAQGRAHAQEMALRWMGLKAQVGITLTNDDIAPEVLLPIIKWFYDDAQAAMEDKAT